MQHLIRYLPVLVFEAVLAIVAVLRGKGGNAVAVLLASDKSA